MYKFYKKTTGQEVFILHAIPFSNKIIISYDTSKEISLASSRKFQETWIKNSVKNLDCMEIPDELINKNG